MKKNEHKTELGALKASLEWSIKVPGRMWQVEGYDVFRVGGKYGRYEIYRSAEPDAMLAHQVTLTLAFRWIAEAVHA
jgi:hypothetical protein